MNNRLLLRKISQETPNPEQGLSLTKEFNVGSGIDKDEINELVKCVFALDVTGLDGSSGGLIHEQGAFGTGSYVGFRPNGDFVLRFGDGALPWSNDTAYMLIPQVDAPSGDGTMVYAFELGIDTNIRIFWNGQEIGSAVVVNNVNEWAGNNTGGYMFLGGGSTAEGEVDTVVPYTTASKLRYYENQEIQI